MTRMTIISIMGYSKRSTSSVSLKVNGCILLERLTPPRLQDILVFGGQLLTYIDMCIGLNARICGTIYWRMYTLLYQQA
jgi:hypothetical protein